MQLKKRLIKKLILFTAIGIAAILAVLFIINAVMIGTTDKFVYSIDEIDNLEKADCVLVLGSLVYSDDSLSHVLQDRVDYAIKIYEAGKADKLLFTGDHGRTKYDEVNAMMNYAVKKGVPKEDIFLDHAGFSTYESMVRARDVFCVTDVIIVTQKFHISRAVYIAKKLGLNVSGVNSNPRRYLNASKDAMRESLARVKDFFYVNVFRPEPTYLGTTIPIFGDSSLTHDKE